MKKKLTKKQRKAKEKAELEAYKSAHITPLYKDNDIDNENELDDDSDFDEMDTSRSEFQNSLTFHSYPSKSMRNVEQAMYDLQIAIGNREFESQDEASAFMNKYIEKSKLNKSVVSDTDTPPDVVAQRIMYEAFNSKTRKKRISLAKKALSIYIGCCDAYNVLAEESDTYDEAISNYEKAVEAGEVYLLNYEPQAPEGEYWMDIRLRPYLRSLEGLANILWEVDEHENSLKVSSHLLEINKSDNQGMRYNHTYRLISLNKFKEARKLLKIYQDDNTLDSLFARFLLNLKENGITEKTRAYFKKAVDSNPDLLGYITNAYKLPLKVPERFTLGSKEEAALTLISFESNNFEEILFSKIVLCGYLLIRDSAIANEKPGATEQDIEMLNEMIKILEDMTNNPKKFEELKEDYEKEFGK